MEFPELLAIVEQTEMIYAENQLEGDPSFALMIQKPAPIDDRGRVLVMSSPRGEPFDLWGEVLAESEEVMKVLVRCQDFRRSVPVHLQVADHSSH